MTFLQKIYVAAAGAVLLGALAAAAWSAREVGLAEKKAEAAARASAVAEANAAKLETAAAEYEAKIGYLEKQLSEIAPIARKQDEEIQKLDVDVSGRRADVERARNIRAIAASAAELCSRLAELGHGCEQ